MASVDVAHSPNVQPFGSPIKPGKRELDADNEFQTPTKERIEERARKLSKLSHIATRLFQDQPDTVIPVKVDSAKKQSPSLVYKVKITEDKESPSCVYFKSAVKHGQQACAALEVLVWEIAQMFHWERYFAATTTTTVTLGDKTLTGSLQPELQGERIVDAVANAKKKNKDVELDRAALLEVNFIVSVMAMWDFHWENGILYKGIAYCFDNPRSLSHSNLFIKNPAGYINSPIRNCLNGLHENWKALKEGEKEQIQSVIDNAKVRLEKLKNYLREPQKATLIATLPENWFKINLILKGMEERIANIENALKSEKIQCLADISIQSSRGYQMTIAFFVAARLLEMKNPKFDLKEFYSFFFVRIGQTPIEFDFDIFNKHGFSAHAILELFADPTLIFDDIIYNIEELVKHHRTIPLYQENRVLNIQNNLKILQHCHNMSEEDWKDWSLPAKQPKPAVVPKSAPLVSTVSQPLKAPVAVSGTASTEVIPSTCSDPNSGEL